MLHVFHDILTDSLFDTSQRHDVKEVSVERYNLAQVVAVLAC
jgi:hypothetical protein